MSNTENVTIVYEQGKEKTDEEAEQPTRTIIHSPHSSTVVNTSELKNSSEAAKTLAKEATSIAFADLERVRQKL
jgi:hypothetical protein